ncbi:MAG TPA: cytochrome C [Bacteroidales bacterium]|nr:cytochrome C [Bacteroidales bacterium]
MKLPESYHNKTTYFGVFLALISLTIFFLLLILSLLTNFGGAYSGLFTYMISPLFIILGLALIPIGMHFKRKRKIQSGETDEIWPVWNLNKPQHRNAFLIFSIGSIVFLTLSIIGSFQAYHYSESNEFCGLMCHQVMAPEYISYSNSAHARVACVECHVGEGADWFVKAKISGLYQVYAYTLNIYPRPIQTPIENLRPAQETCARCHWPEKFYSDALKKFKHYLADENNTEWSIDMNLKVGSDHSAKGLENGIHWHINPNIAIDYVHTDRIRESIPWVRKINKETGDTTIFEFADEMPDAAEFSKLKSRRMDCMDCHNRPSHQYNLPQNFVDNAIISGKIASDLPQFKATAMALLNAKFETTIQAMDSIKSGITSFYETNYTDLYSTRKADIDNAILAVQNGYKINIFPEMKASWDAYVNHLGHKSYKGCFRCHDGQHTSKEGKTISNDCTLCHVILAQGSKDNKAFAQFGQGLEFQHPVDIDGMEKEGRCYDCHRNLYQ